MFRAIEQQQNSVFMNYPIIQSIANDTEWTCSDNEKRPIDAHALLANGAIKMAYLFGDTYPLTTLHKLNESSDLDMVNRTYRFQSHKNRIIMIDVEPSASEDIRAAAAAFPAHYSEISMNGGVHLLIQVPEALINDDNKYIFETTVLKDDSGSFEYIFNNHYATFTKKIIMDKAIADFENNPSDRAMLEQLLASIVNMDRHNKQIREEARRMKNEFNTDNIHTREAQQIVKLVATKKFIEKQRTKTYQEYNNDVSRYEMNVLSASVGYVERFLTVVINETVTLQDYFKNMNDSDTIYTAYLIAQQILPERDKHHEFRSGMPYLLYSAQRALSYIRASSKIKNT